MNKVTRVRIMAVLAVAAMMLSAIGLYTYFSTPDEDPYDDVLELQSLDIESGSYYPWLWVNSTDDSLAMDPGCRLDVNFINQSTGERAFTFSTDSIFLFANGTWTLTHQLDLQNMSPDTYSLDVYVNCTFYGFEATPLSPKHGLIHGSISLPSERPVLPRVLGVKLYPDDEVGYWFYCVEFQDPDQDGDMAYVYVSNKSGFTVFHTPWINNTGMNLTWIMEGYIETTAPFDGLGVHVTDKDGPHSEAWFRW